jgi:hypothetical protein
MGKGIALRRKSGESYRIDGQNIWPDWFRSGQSPDVAVRLISLIATSTLTVRLKSP